MCIRTEDSAMKIHGAKGSKRETGCTIAMSFSVREGRIQRIPKPQTQNYSCTRHM